MGCCSPVMAGCWHFWRNDPVIYCDRISSYLDERIYACMTNPNSQSVSITFGRDKDNGPAFNKETGTQLWINVDLRGVVPGLEEFGVGSTVPLLVGCKARRRMLLATGRRGRLSSVTLPSLSVSRSLLAKSNESLATKLCWTSILCWGAGLELAEDCCL